MMGKEARFPVYMLYWMQVLRSLIPCRGVLHCLHTNSNLYALIM